MHRREPLVTIGTFETSFDASLARGALEAIGIPAYAPAEIQGAFSLNFAGVRCELHVFASDRDRALVELRRMQMRLVD
jgi:hypothetical protein